MEREEPASRTSSFEHRTRSFEQRTSSGEPGSGSAQTGGSHRSHRHKPRVQQTRLLDLKYQLGEELGRGSSGKVYRALNRDTGDFRAIKEIQTRGMPPGHLDSVQSEIDLLHNLQHPQIVRYFETIRTEHHLYLVLEYVENGSLANLQKQFGCFPEQLVANYVRQVLTGLEHLHAHGVCHRDIKGANLLITKEGTVKLADFGVARKQQEPGSSTDGSKANSVVGTPYWMAPEIIEMSNFTTSSDIWSLGCTILELLNGEPPYYELAPIAALYRIVQDEHPPLPPDLSPALQTFLLACFTRDPQLRPTASELRRHVWLDTPLDEPPPLPPGSVGGAQRIGQLTVQTVVPYRPTGKGGGAESLEGATPAGTRDHSRQDSRQLVTDSHSLTHSRQCSGSERQLGTADRLGDKGGGRRQPHERHAAVGPPTSSAPPAPSAPAVHETAAVTAGAGTGAGATAAAHASAGVCACAGSGEGGGPTAGLAADAAAGAAAGAAAAAASPLEGFLWKRGSSWRAFSYADIMACIPFITISARWTYDLGEVDGWTAGASLIGTSAASSS